jgi:hypothetical protein
MLKSPSVAPEVIPHRAIDNCMRNIKFGYLLYPIPGLFHNYCEEFSPGEECQASQ